MQPLKPTDPPSVGKYQLKARLGQGGMGIVYYGRSPGGRPVAVKLILPERIGQGENGFRERFAREIAAARRVPSLFTAPVVDADPHAPSPWLVTEYVAGPSLDAAVRAHGPLPSTTVRVLGAGLAEGLAEIHRCSLVHRDLKPSNIALASDGPRILDFGIARALDTGDASITDGLIGTPAYMSPEQALGEKGIGPASDIFSLGSVLMFAATGRNPFGTGVPAVIMNRIVREAPDLSGLPAELHRIVASCLEQNPLNRPHVQEILDALITHDQTMVDWLPTPVAAMADAPHEPTLRERYTAALRSADAGDWQNALPRLRTVLDEQRKLLGDGHIDTLRTRQRIAQGVGASGDPATAVTRLTEILAEQRELLGPDHEDVLQTRQFLAVAVAQTGDVARAVSLLRVLLPDRRRLLGPDSPATFRTIHVLARSLAVTGEKEEAVAHLRELLALRERFLGDGDRLTELTRRELESLLSRD